MRIFKKLNLKYSSDTNKLKLNNNLNTYMSVSEEYSDSVDDDWSLNSITEVSESELTKDPITVSDLTMKIANAVYCILPHSFDIIGEVSNWKQYNSNIFYKLKDANSQISAVLFNTSNFDNINNIKEGKKVIVTGKINVYQKNGEYNIITSNIRPIGEGELNQKYLSIKSKYSQMGYFDDSHKKPLPHNINKIGVITSVNGAAIEDFISTVKANGFTGCLYIKGCTVQGDTCPKDVSKAVYELDTLNLDVIVITRGGGSFEDLFGFSDSLVIEAIYRAKTPIVSAIGHQVDYMLSDYVADVRAATPTAAADVVTENVFNQNTIDELIHSLKTHIVHCLEINKQKLQSMSQILRSPKDAMAVMLNDVASLENRFKLLIENRLVDYGSILNNLTYKINQNEDQDTVLKKGYSIIFSDDTQIVDSRSFIKLTKMNKKLKIRFHDKDIIVDIK